MENVKFLGVVFRQVVHGTMPNTGANFKRYLASTNSQLRSAAKSVDIKEGASA